MIYYDHNGIVARDSKESDIKHLSDNMRDDDVIELAATGDTPTHSLCYGFVHSTMIVTLELNGEPVAMFGYVPDSLLDSRAIVWMLTTAGVEKIRKTFLKLSRRFIRLMLSHYAELYNYVDARYKRSIDWLNWCGADVLAPIPVGVNGEPFHPFIFRRK